MSAKRCGPYTKGLMFEKNSYGQNKYIMITIYGPILKFPQEKSLLFYKSDFHYKQLFWCDKNIKMPLDVSRILLVTS